MTGNYSFEKGTSNNLVALGISIKDLKNISTVRDVTAIVNISYSKCAERDEK